MSQDLLKNSLLSLERKVKILIAENKTIKDEIKFLQGENDNLRSVVKNKDQQLNDFHNKIKITKIVGNIETEEGEASELKKKIDDYIKEIDKCILHLSK